MPETGRLKIFLGYAPGIGKTYAMLDEATRRAKRGQRVVIAALETGGRSATADLAEALPRIPTAADGGVDVAAAIAAAPDVVILDGLHHRNPSGAAFSCRWEEAEALLAEGVHVLATLSVRHLESLVDHVADITGLKTADTVPDRLLHDADEVEIVDLPVRALLNRIERGDVFPDREPTEEERAFFREGNLQALREIALREAAGRVDEDLNAYRREKRIEKPWAAQDRVMLCISPTRSSLRLIRRGWRMGQRMHGQVFAVHVEDGSDAGENAARILAEDFALCDRLGIETVKVKGELSPTLIRIARERNATAVLLGHPERGRLKELLRPSVLSDLARELRTVDIIVVATEVAPAQA